MEKNNRIGSYSQSGTGENKVKKIFFWKISFPKPMDKYPPIPNQRLGQKKEQSLEENAIKSKLEMD